MEEQSNASGSSKKGLTERGQEGDADRRGKGRNQKKPFNRNRPMGYMPNNGGFPSQQYGMPMNYGMHPSFGPYYGGDGTGYWDPSAFGPFPFEGADPSMMGYFPPATGSQKKKHKNENRSDSGWSSRRRDRGKGDEDVSVKRYRDGVDDNDDEGRESRAERSKRRRQSNDRDTDEERKSNKEDEGRRSPIERLNGLQDEEDRHDAKRASQEKDDSKVDERLLGENREKVKITFGPKGKEEKKGERDQQRGKPRRDTWETDSEVAGRMQRTDEDSVEDVWRKLEKGKDDEDDSRNREGTRKWGNSERSDEGWRTREGRGKYRDVKDRISSGSHLTSHNRNGSATYPSKNQESWSEDKIDSTDIRSEGRRHREDYRLERDSGWSRGPKKTDDESWTTRRDRVKSNTTTEYHNRERERNRSPRVDSKRSRRSSEVESSSERQREPRRSDEYTSTALEDTHRHSAYNRNRRRSNDEDKSLLQSDSDADSRGNSNRRRREKEHWRDKDDRPRKRDDKEPPPSDAMQAAMESALGLPMGSLKSNDESIHQDKVREDEENRRAPYLLRARPDEIYEQIAQVGEGTYGQVFKAKGDRTGIVVALKKIRMESEKDGFPITAMREIKLLQGLRHENVVRLHEMLLSKNSIYMVFEYLEHDLNGILSQPSIQFEPAHLKSLAFQLLSGLAYLHRHSILHRDLKGSNLLLNSEGTLKLADFGLARRYTKRSKRNVDYTNRVVTLWYRPPELLFGETCYNDAIDVWGAGCIFIELFTRKPIFQGNDEIHQVQLLLDLLGPIDKQDWPEVDTLPWYDLVRPSEVEEGKEGDGKKAINGQKKKGQIHDLFASQMPSDALDVAAALLSYNPARRVSASSALRMEYFARNLPRPEKPKKVLEKVIGDWHELESRQARRGLLPPPTLHRQTIDNKIQNGSSATPVEAMSATIGEMGPPSIISTGSGPPTK